MTRPGFERTITCPVMDRPELFDRMLASLVRNDLDGWHLFVTAEPGAYQDEFAPICARHLPEGSYTVTVNPRRLGLRANLYQVMHRAFAQGSVVNLYLEEDFLVAPDVTALAEWFLTNRRDHWLCLNLLAGACGNPGYLSHTDLPELLIETDCFNSYGLVMTPEGWARIKDAWRGPDPRVTRAYDFKAAFLKGRRHLAVEGWDWAVWSEVLHEEALKVVQPVAARCTHTGTEGHHCNPDYQDRAYGHITLADARPGGYRVVSVRNLPDRARAHAEALAYAAHLTQAMDDPRYPRKPAPLRWICAGLTRRYGHPLEERD